MSKKLTNKTKEILEYIKVIRLSFNDASVIYKYGACYSFYKILKYTYKEAEAYMYNGQHVLIKIDDNFYDIDGYIQVTEEIEKEIKEMSELDHYMAETWLDGQRVERMLKKYSEDNL